MVFMYRGKWASVEKQLLRTVCFLISTLVFLTDGLGIVSRPSATYPTAAVDREAVDLVAVLSDGLNQCQHTRHFA